MQMGLMSKAQREGRWIQKATRDGESDDSAMQWALSSLSHGGVYRHLKPRYHRRTQTDLVNYNDELHLLTYVASSCITLRIS